MEVIAGLRRRTRRKNRERGGGRGEESQEPRNEYRETGAKEGDKELAEQAPPSPFKLHFYVEDFHPHTVGACKFSQRARLYLAHGERQNVCRDGPSQVRRRVPASYF